MSKQSESTVRAVSLAVLMVCSTIGGGVTFTGSVAADHPDVDVSDLEGSGTEDDPYMITTAPELQAMEDDLDANYMLGNDIDASETSEWNNGLGFTPIGDSSSEFEGRFNGNNYTISNLTIDRPECEDVGLFGQAIGARITAVHLTDVAISGGDNVGTLAGDLKQESVAQDVHVSGSVTGVNDTGGVVGDLEDNSVVRDASVMGIISGSDGIGGIIGDSIGGVVTRSSSNATVTATGEFQQENARAGGLVGGNFNGGVINRSYATGNVSGGKAGGITGENYNSSRVAHTYVAGPVSGNSRVTGGIVGENFQDCPFTDGSTRCSDFESSTVANSYWDTQSTEQSASSGETTSAAGTGLTTAAMQGEAARDNMAGLDFETTWQTQPDDYPTLTTLDDQSDDSEPEADDDAVYDPESVAGEYDSNGDGQITASELGSAVTDFGQGEVTASELGEVVTAFGQS